MGGDDGRTMVAGPASLQVLSVPLPTMSRSELEHSQTLKET